MFNARENQCSKNVIGADNGFSVRKKGAEQGWDQGEGSEALALDTKFKGMPKTLSHQDKSYFNVTLFNHQK